MNIFFSSFRFKVRSGSGSAFFFSVGSGSAFFPAGSGSVEENVGSSSLPPGNGLEMRFFGRRDELMKLLVEKTAMAEDPVPESFALCDFFDP